MTKDKSQKRYSKNFFEIVEKTINTEYITDKSLINDRFKSDYNGSNTIIRNQTVIVHPDDDLYALVRTCYQNESSAIPGKLTDNILSMIVRMRENNDITKGYIVLGGIAWIKEGGIDPIIKERYISGSWRKLFSYAEASRVKILLREEFEKLIFAGKIF